MESYEIAVIGGGLFGSAAAKYSSYDFPNGETLLIGPGAGLEDDPTLNTFRHISGQIGNENHMLGGAWHDEGRISKRLEHGDVWQSFVKHSMDRYRDIEAESEINFFEEVGFLRIGQKSDPRLNDVTDLVNKLKKEGLEINNVDDRYLEDNFPYLRMPENYIAYHQPDKAGHISPRKLVKAQQKIASLKNGCKFINGCATHIEKQKELFDIHISKYSDSGYGNDEIVIVKARRVIIATGAYANVKPDIQSILPKEIRGQNFAMDLVTETVALIEVSEKDVNEKLKGMPCIVTSYKSELVDGSYILPPILYPDGNWYIKIGHSKSFEKNLKHDEKELKSWYNSGGNKEAVESLANFLCQSLIPGLNVQSIQKNCCITTRSAGSSRRSPFIDTIIPNVTLIINGCGLGAKGSDEIGRIGAKLATTQEWKSNDVNREELRIHWMSS